MNEEANDKTSERLVEGMTCKSNTSSRTSMQSSSYTNIKASTCPWHRPHSERLPPARLFSVNSAVMLGSPKRSALKSSMKPERGRCKDRG